MQAHPPSLTSAPIVVSAATASAATSAGLALFAIDPAEPISVNAGQSFIIALRATLDGGYGWKVEPSAAQSVIRFDRDFAISDVSYTNANQPPSTPDHPRALMVGGEATQYFLFSAVGAGSTTVTLNLYRFGREKQPNTTKTFTVQVAP